MTWVMDQYGNTKEILPEPFIRQARNDQHLQPKWSPENIFQIRHECFQDQTPTDPRKLPQYQDKIQELEYLRNRYCTDIVMMSPETLDSLKPRFTTIWEVL